MTSPSALEVLRRDGFVVLPSLLDEGRIAELVSALAPFESARPMGRNDFEGTLSQRVYSLAGKGEVFMRLASHPAILELLDAYLLPNPLLSTLQSIRLHPGETAQPWHTDDAFYAVPRPHPAPLGLSVIWALEDFTEENGATRVIPGSHLWGNEHPDSHPHEVKVSVMRRGSALVFDGATWHQGGANHSSGTRLCISPQYCQPWLRTQESQLLICPPEIAKTYDAPARSLLGYSIHPPFIGQVEGMHPVRLLDPTYRGVHGPARIIADRLLTRPKSDMTEKD